MDSEPNERMTDSKLGEHAPNIKAPPHPLKEPASQAALNRDMPPAKKRKKLPLPLRVSNNRTTKVGVVVKFS